MPGAGKSTFARWLVDKKGFTHADTDRGATAALEQVASMTERGQPVVWEYGMWVRVDTVQTLRHLEAMGAAPWWFDGDRDAAFTAWISENVKSHRPFADRLWRDVVRAIDDNWRLIQEFFGPKRILRTIEAGPVHVAPEVTYAAMYGEGETEPS